MHPERLLDPSVLAAMAVQTTLWALLGLLAARLLERRPARAHAVLMAATVAAALCPLALAVTHAAGWGLFGAMSPGPPAAAAAPPPLETPLEASGPGGPALLLFAWSALSLIMLGRLALRSRSSRRFLGRTRPVSDPALTRAAVNAARSLGIGLTPELRTSAGVRGPAIWCWGHRPVIVLPEPSADLEPADWTGVFGHELAHWRRRDHWWALLAEIAICLVPWQPLLWWSRRSVHRLSEQSCDAWAAATTIAPADLARLLLRFVPARPLPGGLPMATDARGLRRRIRSLIERGPADPRPGRLLPAAAAALLFAGALLGAAAHQRPPEVGATGAAEPISLAPNLVEEGPAVRVTPVELRLGAVAPGGTGQGRAWLTNVGDETVELLGYRATCGCTTVTGFAPGPLAPGAALPLEIHMTAPDEPGQAKMKQVVFRIAGQAPLVLPVHLHTTAEIAIADEDR